MRSKLLSNIVGICGLVNRSLKDRRDLLVVNSDIIDGHALDAIVEMLLQLIFEQLQFALRVKVDELVEVAVVIHLKEEQCSLPDVGIGMLAFKPLL